MKIKFNMFNLKRDSSKKYFTWFEFSISQCPDSYDGWWVQLAVFNWTFNINVCSNMTAREYLESHDFN